jgi:protein-tyrosine phosphatase
MQLGAEDRDGYPMLQRHWVEASGFVKAARAMPDGKVLIHCFAGVNRSGLLATAALMVHEQICVLDALRHVRQRRGDVLLNSTFRESLVQLAADSGLLGLQPDLA